MKKSRSRRVGGDLSARERGELSSKSYKVNKTQLNQAQQDTTVIVVLSRLKSEINSKRSPYMAVR